MGERFRGLGQVEQCFHGRDHGVTANASHATGNLGESQERTEFQARTSVTLSELNDAVQILTSKIDDTGQSLNNRGGRDSGGSRPSTGVASAADSAAAATSAGVP